MPYQFVDEAPAAGRYVFVDPANPQAADDIAAVQNAAAKGAPSASDRFQAAEAGLGQGFSYLAALPVDSNINTANLMKTGIGTAYHKLTGNDIPEWLQVNQGASPAGAKLAAALDKYSHGTFPTTVDRPDDAASRYIATGASVIPGALIGGGAGGAEAGTSVIGPAIRATAGALPSAEAGRAVMETQPFGDNSTANMAASAAAQLGLGYGLPAVTKFGIRGPNGADMQQTAEDFRAAGAEPTVGQASQSRPMQFIESGLAKIPGGAGVIHKAATDQAAGMGQTLSGAVNELSPGGATPEQAGTAISEGVTGGYKPAVDQLAAAKYAALDAKIPPDTDLTPTNTIAAFNRATRVIPGAEATSAALANKSLITLRDAFLADAGSGDEGALSMPYEAVKAMRSEIGSRLGESSLTSDIPRSQLKQVYAGLSQDMQGAAQNAGAMREFDDANGYFKMKQGQLDDLDRLINKNGGPEAIFRGALSGTKDGATVLNRVMGTDPNGTPILSPEQRNVVTAAVMDRMGKATPGNQNAAGDLYSPQTFLTNWNRLHPDAKDALFGTSGNLRDTVENFANVADNLRQGSKVFANPSGTGPAMNQSETLKHFLDLAVGAVAGHGLHQGIAPGAVAGAIGIPTAAYVGAKAMTSPTVVDWAGRPAFGSGSQLGSFTAAQDTFSDKQRRLADALRAVGGQ
jgi:hypothetical protein